MSEVHFSHVQFSRRWKYFHAMYVVAGDVISHLLCGLIVDQYGDVTAAEELM